MLCYLNFFFCIRYFYLKMKKDSQNKKRKTQFFDKACLSEGEMTDSCKTYLICVYIYYITL